MTAQPFDEIRFLTRTVESSAQPSGGSLAVSSHVPPVFRQISPHVLRERAIHEWACSELYGPREDRVVRAQTALATGEHLVGQSGQDAGALRLLELLPQEILISRAARLGPGGSCQRRALLSR
jgi:hypothetical protein